MLIKLLKIGDYNKAERPGLEIYSSKTKKEATEKLTEQGVKHCVQTESYDLIIHICYLIKACIIK